MKTDPFAVTDAIPARHPMIPQKSATVRWRLKGQTDGPVYSGQQMIKGCRTCGKPDDARKMTLGADDPGLSETKKT